MSTKILIVLLSVITVFAIIFSGCSSMKEQSSPDLPKEEATNVIPSTIQETTQEQTTKTPKTEPERPTAVKSDDWLTINSVEKQSDGFGGITDCAYTGFNYSFGENEMEGPVLYGSVELSVDEKDITSFGSILILPDGSNYNGYDFKTSYYGKKFAVSLPKELSNGDYSFELQLFRENDGENRVEDSSKSLVKFTIKN